MRSKVQRASDRIIKAALELNNAVRAAWDEHDHHALGRAYRDLGRKLDRSSVEGEPIDRWFGNPLNHSDAIEAVMQLIECYSEKKDLLGEERSGE